MPHSSAYVHANAFDIEVDRHKSPGGKTFLAGILAMLAFLGPTDRIQVSAGADKQKPKPAANAARPALQLMPFNYHGVTIEQGLLRVQIDRAHKDYLRIPNDDLLKGFRKRAGRPAPGKDLGGWYTGDVFHVFGQVLSGLARLYAVTGDPACRAKAEALLVGWADCIEKDGFFYYSRTPNAPHYIYDKMVGGLTDMVVHCHSKSATRHLARITAWAEKHLKRTKRIPDGGEWYTLSENLYRAADATGDRRYRAFAAVWHYDSYWGVLAHGADPFARYPNGERHADYHAYSHVNTLGGAAQAYLHGGDLRYFDTLTQAYDYFQANQCFATGGFGPAEQLLPRAAWRQRLADTHASFETQCGCFAVFKLCKYLLTLTGEAKYGDWIERVAINGFAASIPMSATGHVFYYSDYNPGGGVKRNHPVAWTCCTGTRPMAAADLFDLVYFKGGGDLYVNLYLPSTVVWDRPQGRVTVHQATRFPEEDGTQITVKLARPAMFGVMLRVPGWLAGPLTVSVNGRPVKAEMGARGWATVRREWHDGDRLGVVLPAKLALAPLDSTQRFPTAIVRGPVVLAVRSVRNAGALAAAPDLAKALAPVKDAPLTYRAAQAGAGDWLVLPFYAIKEDVLYYAYLDPRLANRFSYVLGRFKGEWADSNEFRFSKRPGDSVTFDFTGTGVRWYGKYFDDAGIADVAIDGKVVGQVAQYGPRRDVPFQWEKRGLPAGRHRLLITIRKDKPAASKDRYINVAGFEVIP
jgi:DUF1680 family protein